MLATWHNGRVSVVLSCGHFRFSIPTRTHIPFLSFLPCLRFTTTHDRCTHVRSPLRSTACTHDLHSTQVVLKKKKQMRVDPYGGWNRESNLRLLRRVGQPDSHFTGQVRGELMRDRLTRFAIPNTTHCFEHNMIRD